MKNWISFSIKLDNGKVFPVQTQKCDGIWPHTQILPLSLSLVRSLPMYEITDFNHF